MTPPQATDFCWKEAREQLAGLAGGAINIAYEAADRHVADGRGDRLALRCFGRRYERRDVTYSELAEQSSRVAAVLKGLGVVPGEAVAVLLDRSAELYFSTLGIWKAGAVFAPLFTAFGPGPLKARIEMANAAVLIASASLYQRKLASLRGMLPNLRHVLLVPDADVMAGCSDLSALAAAADPKDGQAVPTSPEAPAFIHFTSGTTGVPKGAIHPHRVVVSLLATGKQVFGLNQDDVFWCTADPGWITGTAYAMIAPLVNGCLSLVDAHDMDPRRWYDHLKDEQVTVWYTTPTAIRMMMRLGAALARGYRDNSLRVAASVGEPLSAEAVAWGEKALGVPFLDTWWQTETGAIAIANMPGQAKYGSMGKPLPGVEVAIMRRDLSRVIPVTQPDEPGELALKADLPSLFGAYIGDPVRTQAAFIDGWYLSGDLVRRDADGFFWFIGRTDDMIKSAAQTVGPFEIESVLMEHPAVAEIGVVGKPDQLLREVPVAFVSLNPGFEPGDALNLELLSFSCEQLGASIAPREVHFIESMPKTTTGKILRRALKAKAVGEPDEGERISPAAMRSRFDDE